MTGKTLKELNVKPGDVVRWVKGNNEHEIISAYVITSDAFTGQVRAVLSDYGDGVFGDDEEFTIVSRASDAPKDDTPKPWGQLTPEEKGALLLDEHEGREVQVWVKDHGSDSRFRAKMPRVWSDHLIYRRAPEPKHETVNIYGCGYEWGQASKSCDEDTHIITFDTIDGEPDCASIKMERLP